MPSIRYNFPYGHPLKRRPTARTGQTGTDRNRNVYGGAFYKETVYYYWWRFLRHSERYRILCETGDNAGDQKLQQVFDDFGDIHSKNFWEWHGEEDGLPTNRFAWLFGVPVLNKVERVVAADMEDNENILYLAIPLDLTINKTMTQVRKVISENHSGKRGKRNTAYYKERAKYVPVHGKYVPLKTALEVYELRKKNPNKGWWWIGNEMAGDLSASKITQEELNSTDPVTRAWVSARKNTLKSLAHRTFKRAIKYIEGAERGRFPINSKG
jgi:hypothetical protein